MDNARPHNSSSFQLSIVNVHIVWYELAHIFSSLNIPTLTELRPGNLGIPFHVFLTFLQRHPFVAVLDIPKLSVIGSITLPFAPEIFLPNLHDKGALPCLSVISLYPPVTGAESSGYYADFFRALGQRKASNLTIWLYVSCMQSADHHFLYGQHPSLYANVTSIVGFELNPVPTNAAINALKPSISAALFRWLSLFPYLGSLRISDNLIPPITDDQFHYPYMWNTCPDLDIIEVGVVAFNRPYSSKSFNVLDKVA